MGKPVIIILLCMIMIIGGLASCNTAGEEQEEHLKEAGSEIQIGITFDTFVLERWTRDRDVFVATAQKMGAQVDVQNANGDVEKQKEQIQKFIKDQKDVIVIVAVDCYSVSEQVEQARNAGIKVISYDRLIQGVRTDLYVTVDNEMVGQKMAKTIIEKLPNGGNVVMICGPEMDTNSEDVMSGFETELKGSNLSVVSKTHVKSWTPENGFQAVNEAFSEADKIDAVMCGNDGLAGYAIKALSEQRLAGQVIVVGQDADLEACQRIVEGTQTMTVYKPIEQLAKIAAESAVKLAQGQTVTGTDDTYETVRMTEDGWDIPYLGLAPTAVLAENMDDVIIKQGFHLRDEVYLNVENQ